MLVEVTHNRTPARFSSCMPLGPTSSRLAPTRDVPFPLRGARGSSNTYVLFYFVLSSVVRTVDTARRARDWWPSRRNQRRAASVPVAQPAHLSALASATASAGGLQWASASEEPSPRPQEQPGGNGARARSRTYGLSHDKTLTLGALGLKHAPLRAAVLPCCRAPPCSCARSQESCSPQSVTL